LTEHLQCEIERTLGLASNLEKKETGFEQTCLEWKKKYEEINAELDASQREVTLFETPATCRYATWARRASS